MNQLPKLSSGAGREILAFFDFLPTRLSNGFVEGNNNRTKALMGQGYGYWTPYRDQLHCNLHPALLWEVIPTLMERAKAAASLSDR